MQMILIHGPAASGKLTVAKALQRLNGFRLFHNHLAVDAVLALFEFGTPSFVRLREAIWLSAFAEAAEAGQSLIFTFHPEASVRAGFISAAVEAIKTRGGQVHFVALECPEGEIERRLINPDRSQFRKLTSLEDYRRLRTAGAFDFPSLPLPVITIRTDLVGPEEAARAIHSRLAKG